MGHHPGFRVALGVAVAGDVISGVGDGDTVAGLGQLTADHRARESRPD
jgi:hypothetical protein